ncbi:MAG: Gfo/Idh/MocA family protein [Candidatus Sulfotelmatobacter sp.]
MVRLGLIGCGEHSEIGHVLPLARYRKTHPHEIALTAACDLQLARAELFRTKYGFERTYIDVDEMLAREKLDGCIIVVPSGQISALGIKLLKTGIPCVVEKPLGSTLAEVQALREAAETTGTPNMVSVNRRFMPFLNAALEWTRSVGTIQYVHCTMARHARIEPQFIWETAVHSVDSLRYICGEVGGFSVRRLNEAQAGAAYGIDLTFKNESAGRIDVLPTAGMVEETYDLFGEKFRVTVTSPFGPQRGWRALHKGKVVKEEAVTADMPEDEVFGFYAEASALVYALGKGKKLEPTIADVAPSVELCMAVASQ